MKNITRIFWFLLATILFISCEKETGALFENKDGKLLVSLASDKYVAELNLGDDNKIDLQVYRGSTQGALNVDFEFDSPSPLFTMADPIAHFADGKETASLTISIDGIDKLQYGVSYEMTVDFKDSTMVSIGGIRKQTITVARKLTWKKSK